MATPPAAPDLAEPILLSLARHAAGLRLQDLPAPVLRRVDEVVMDLIGSTYVALQSPRAGALWRYARALNPAPQALLWGTGERVGLAEAATVNGAMGYDAEFDDGNTLGGHWGSSCIPAALALAEQRRASAQELVLAVVCGYELGNRVSRMLSRPLLEKGVHFPGTMGALGAIAGCGRLMGLPADTLAGALGYAAFLPLAPYVLGHAGSPAKDFYSGWPNHCGIHFTALAQAGFCGPADVLEGRDGLAQVLGYTGSAQELAAGVLAGLGRDFALTQTYFKPYPCCRWLQAPVRALLDLMAGPGLQAADVLQVRVLGPAFLRMYASPEPCGTATQGKYSLAYCVAATLVHRSLGQPQFEPDQLGHPEVAALLPRVEYRLDDELEAAFPARFSTRVLVQLRDGRTLQAQQTPPWGPQAPPGFDARADKFTAIMAPICGAALTGRWRDYFERGLLADADLSGLFGLLQASVVPARSSY